MCIYSQEGIKITDIIKPQSIETVPVGVFCGETESGDYFPRKISMIYSDIDNNTIGETFIKLEEDSKLFYESTEFEYY